jgi:hypothetical protein
MPKNDAVLTEELLAEDDFVHADVDYFREQAIGR